MMYLVMMYLVMMYLVMMYLAAIRAAVVWLTGRSVVSLDGRVPHHGGKSSAGTGVTYRLGITKPLRRYDLRVMH